MRSRYSTSLKVLLIALTIFGGLITATFGVVHAQDAGKDGTPLPEEAPTKIDDPPSDAELQDLQALADRDGISLQEAIDRYAWHDNFSKMASTIREAAPEDFAGAEIVGPRQARIAFAGQPPKAALDILDIFRNSHSGVSVEVRTGLGYSEAELQIELSRQCTMRCSGLLGCATPLLRSIRRPFRLGRLSHWNLQLPPPFLMTSRAIMTQRLIDETRPDILNTISAFCSPLELWGLRRCRQHDRESGRWSPYCRRYADWVAGFRGVFIGLAVPAPGRKADWRSEEESDGVGTPLRPFTLTPVSSTGQALRERGFFIP